MKLSIEDSLRNNKYLIYSITGNSMSPLLIGNDKVKLEKCDEYDVFDIVLFKRSDNIYVLHRIVDINNNNYVIMGDNSPIIDHLTKDKILGKLTGKYINENLVDINKINIDKTSILESIKEGIITNPDAYFFNRKKEAYYELIKLITFGNFDDKKITKLKEFELIEFIKFLKCKKAIHLLGFAIEKFNLNINKKYKDFLVLEYQKSIKRITKLEYIIDEFSKILSDNKIKHIFLKGPEIKRLYKFPYLRISNDLDIYVNKDQLKETCDVLVKQLSCKIQNNYTETTHDIGLIYLPLNIKIELHYSLSSSLPNDLKHLLDNPFNKAIEDDKYEYRYHLNNDDEVLYFLIHTIKHIVLSEFWYTNIVDYYYLSKLDFNKDLISKTNLNEFKNCFDDYVDSVYKNKTLNEKEMELEKILFKISTESNLAIGRNNISKSKYIFSKIFVPYSRLKHRYKVLKKHPILFPFVTIYRWIGLPFKLVKRKKIDYKEAKESYESIRKVMNDLNLGEYVTTLEKSLSFQK